MSFVPHSSPAPSPDESIVELALRSGVRPFRSLDELAPEDPFGSDEEYEEFLADLRASRRAGS